MTVQMKDYVKLSGLCYEILQADFVDYVWLEQYMPDDMAKFKPKALTTANWRGYFSEFKVEDVEGEGECLILDNLSINDGRENFVYPLISGKKPVAPAKVKVNVRKPPNTNEVKQDFIVGNMGYQMYKNLERPIRLTGEMLVARHVDHDKAYADDIESRPYHILYAQEVRALTFVDGKLASNVDLTAKARTIRKALTDGSYCFYHYLAKNQEMTEGW